MQHYTVNVERFAWLNIRPVKFLRDYFRGALVSSAYYLTIAKFSQENLRDALKNRENLAHQIFPRLRYNFFILTNTWEFFLTRPL